MYKTTLLSIAAVLASSAVLTDASHSAVLSQPDTSNDLEQRIEKLSDHVRAQFNIESNNNPLIARAWGNGGGRAWGNGGGRGRGFANGGGSRGFANGYRAGFANW